MISILKTHLIRWYYTILRIFMRKKWCRRYIDYMENYRFSKKYEQHRRKIFQLLAAERPDIMDSPIRRKAISFRMAMLATMIGEEPDCYWDRDYPHSSIRQRCASITGARLNFGNDIFNDPEKIYLLSDKFAFSQHWNSFYQRKICCPQELAEEEFCALFSDMDKLVVKPRNGACGQGVRLVSVQNGLPDLYRQLADGEPVIVEEHITQSGLLHELNPSSLNTIRVITLRINGQIIPASAYLRLGRPGCFTDNTHTGGVSIVIHIPDGKLLDGQSMTRNRLHAHPLSGVSFAGYSVPRWKEVLEFCIRAHQNAPDGLDRIGWDVCVDENHLLLIEGNECPGFSPWRKGNPDCWKLFKNYFNTRESSL